MSSLSRASTFAWLTVLAGALLFLVWSHSRYAGRAERISALAGAVAAVDPQSPTGYAGGVRLLLIPGQNHDSMQWIAQTQQMLARGEWRVRHVDYDNAPTGRTVRSSSAYRWWLALIAWGRQAIAGGSIGIAVEQAALWADPVLHVMMLVCGAFFVARNFGALPAALFSIGVAALFPLAGSFVPGQPGDRGLALACALGSVLPLLAGTCASWPISSADLRRHFLVAGIIGGFGIWIDVGSQFPVVIGMLLGGLAVAWSIRAPWPWRTWAAAGAVTSLALYAIEFFPGQFAMAARQFDVGHPLYAAAWLGAGELLARGASWLRGDRPVWNARTITITGLATLAVIALPVTLAVSDGNSFLTPPNNATCLTLHAGAAEAESLLAWWSHDGFSFPVWATLLPLVILVPVGWLLVARRTAGSPQAAALALALGPALVALAFAFAQLRWWSTTDVFLLLAAVAAYSVHARSNRSAGMNRVWSGAAAAVFLFGLPAGWPSMKNADDVTETEVTGMIERDLAHWLAARAPVEGAVVLAPPALTASLCYYGGLRGLGTPYRENVDGFRAALRIAASSSPDEAQAIAVKRELTHIVVPTWDRFLDEYARLGSNQPDQTLIGMLHQWLPPRWLRPLSYQVPQIPGLAPQQATIFAVVDTQDNATALSGLADYFLETGRLDMAAGVSHALAESFPADLGGLVARAQTALAGRDGRELTNVMKAITAALERGEERDLRWDQRVRLALLLAQAGKPDVARPQLQACANELDGDRMRWLSSSTLYRLFAALKAFNVPLPDSRLQELGQSLLPAEMRERP